MIPRISWIVATLLGVSAFVSAGVSLEVRVKFLAMLGAFGVEAVAVPNSEATLLLGTTNAPGFETIGEPLVGLACYVSIVRQDLAYFRYLPGLTGCSNGVIGGDGSLWFLAGKPEEKFLAVDYDLAPGTVESQLWTRYLVRVRISDGAIQSVTRFRNLWADGLSGSGPRRLAIDSKGFVWLGGYAREPIPLTPDAIDTTRPQNTSSFPGSLIKFSPDGARIVYATYLGDARDAVAELAIDAEDNVIAVGSRVWKLSNDGQIIWSTRIENAEFLTVSLGTQGEVFAGGCTRQLTTGVPFFTTAGAFQTNTENTLFTLEMNPPYFPRTCTDGFAMKFTSDGHLVYSTLVSGPWRDQVNSVMARPDGSVIVTGQTVQVSGHSRDVLFGGNSPATTRMFVARINAEGSDVSFFSPLGAGLSFNPRPILRGDAVSLYGSQSGIQAGEITVLLVEGVLTESATPALLRVDKVSATGGRDTAGVYQLEILGEGFDADARVFLDGIEVPVLAATTGKLKTAPFIAPVPDPKGIYPSWLAGVYDLVILRGDGTQSRPVRLELSALGG